MTRPLPFTFAMNAPTFRNPRPATSAELQALTGIGAAVADRIVRERVEAERRSNKHRPGRVAGAAALAGVAATEEPGERRVVVPRGVFAPWNAQATVHARAAFWAALLPMTVPGRTSDIWRAHFANRLFEIVGLEVVFAEPRVTQHRNAHNYLGDMDAEHDLYHKTSALLAFLSQWTPAEDETTTAARMQALWVALYERTYIEEGDVKMLQLWLQALRESGYTAAAFR